MCCGFMTEWMKAYARDSTYLRPTSKQAVYSGVVLPGIGGNLSLSLHLKDGDAISFYSVNSF